MTISKITSASTLSNYQKLKGTKPAIKRMSLTYPRRNSRCNQIYAICLIAIVAFQSAYAETAKLPAIAQNSIYPPQMLESDSLSLDRSTRDTKIPLSTNEPEVERIEQTREPDEYVDSIGTTVLSDQSESSHEKKPWNKAVDLFWKTAARIKF